MISHRNMMTSCLASKSKIELGQNDIYLSYLPMAHSLERNFFFTMIWFQGQIGVYGGDILKIKEDLAIL